MFRAGHLRNHSICGARPMGLNSSGCGMWLWLPKLPKVGKDCRKHPALISKRLQCRKKIFFRLIATRPPVLVPLKRLFNLKSLFCASFYSIPSATTTCVASIFLRKMGPEIKKDRYTIKSFVK